VAVDEPNRISPGDKEAKSGQATDSCWQGLPGFRIVRIGRGNVHRMRAKNGVFLPALTLDLILSRHAGNVFLLSVVVKCFSFPRYFFLLGFSAI